MPALCKVADRLQYEVQQRERNRQYINQGIKSEKTMKEYPSVSHTADSSPLFQLRWKEGSLRGSKALF